MDNAVGTLPVVISSKIIRHFIRTFSAQDIR